MGSAPMPYLPPEGERIGKQTKTRAQAHARAGAHNKGGGLHAARFNWFSLISDLKQQIGRIDKILAPHSGIVKRNRTEIGLLRERDSGQAGKPVEGSAARPGV